ncbi:lipoprotein [Roseococcus pinisoli]|uniref:Type IV secretion system putative lipoprotein virB7 n=1 Tax=Roseococcus pinisoli TaxID=2835040 RepID=A0ABS5QFZ9_9PROT|nr:lipoprotein [Roseococcus pinisoli]MBS7812303.1 lipoprotein [Roseococcus pinisoli]
MKKTILTLTAALTLAACSDGPTAKRVAEDQGFTQVETTGYRWSGCGEQDSYRTGFRALSPNGRRVSGVVCSSSFFGFGKTNTLRLD